MRRLRLKAGSVVATADSLPAVLRQLREESGLSQRDLALKAGTTASVICRLENPAYRGHSLDTLRRVGAVLGLSIGVQFSPVAQLPIGGTVSKRC